MIRKLAIAGCKVSALVVLAAMCIICLPLTVFGQADTLRMELDNSSGNLINELVPLSIYIALPALDSLGGPSTDTCGGFVISLALNRPDLMYFEVDTVESDTVYDDPPFDTIISIDTSYVCSVDVAGTLTEDWDAVEARSTVGKGLDLRIHGFGDTDGTHPEDLIMPSTSGILCKIFGRIKPDIPDTLTDRDVIMDPNNCYYSNREGDLIQPVKNVPGTVSVGVPIIGDVNCDNEITPVDVVYLVNFVYKGWQVLCRENLADMDCVDGVTPVDVVYLVNFVFKSWPYPAQPCGSCPCP